MVEICYLSNYSFVILITYPWVYCFGSRPNLPMISWCPPPLSRTCCCGPWNSRSWSRSLPPCLRVSLPRNLWFHKEWLGPASFAQYRTYPWLSQLAQASCSSVSQLLHGLQAGIELSLPNGQIFGVSCHLQALVAKTFWSMALSCADTFAFLPWMWSWQCGGALRTWKSLSRAQVTPQPISGACSAFHAFDNTGAFWSSNRVSESAMYTCTHGRDTCSSYLSPSMSEGQLELNQECLDHHPSSSSVSLWLCRFLL